MFYLRRHPSKCALSTNLLYTYVSVRFWTYLQSRSDQEPIEHPVQFLILVSLSTPAYHKDFRVLGNMHKALHTVIMGEVWSHNESFRVTQSLEIIQSVNQNISDQCHVSPTSIGKQWLHFYACLYAFIHA